MVPFWKTALLEGLRAHGGEADMVDIYKWLEAQDWLGPKDLEVSRYEGRQNYQHTMRTCASQMVKKGELERVRPGRFRLLGA